MLMKVCRAYGWTTKSNPQLDSKIIPELLTCSHWRKHFVILSTPAECVHYCGSGPQICECEDACMTVVQPDTTEYLLINL